VGDALCVGLRLPDEGLQPPLELRGRYLVEAVVDLAGIDQIGAFASANEKAKAHENLYFVSLAGVQETLDAEKRKIVFGLAFVGLYLGMATYFSGVSQRPASSGGEMSNICAPFLK
jgi:hypothetical protein